MNAETLAQVLRPIEQIYRKSDYPNLLVGLEEPDDAAVWQLNEQTALVVTVDFFTPIVDDPYDYGAIAAANSLSDLYAMGARPFMALNIAALPPQLPTDLLSEIVRGGAEKAREAGVVVVGGHTVQDSEPKFGLVALGFVNVDRILTKRGARLGDRMVLTKPIGTGVITSALKQDRAMPADVAEAVAWMKRLNHQARDLAVDAGLKAATDITGFGLLGHAWEMAHASGVGMRFDFGCLPILESARIYGEMGSFPGGAFDNRAYFGQHVRFSDRIREVEEMLLFDPQTSGGLLMAVPPERLPAIQAQAQALQAPLWEVGEVIAAPWIEVIRE